ncbi:MAG: YncE family protein [Kofleriaceae bacterium]|nr:YncE family protein [Kofleriaceae bacterium]
MRHILGASFALLVGCGGHHADPSSTAIAPVTEDAVFVVNGDDASLSVISVATDEVVGTIKLGNVEYPHHVYLSSDGETMLVAVPGADLSGGHSGGHGGHGDGGGAVVVLDASTGALKAARRLDAPNHNAIYAQDGSIWTTQIASPGEVLILDPATLSTTSMLVAGNDPAEVTFSSAGTRAFVANTASDSVSVFDAASGALIDTIAVGVGPVGAWPAADGNMYVDNETGKSLTVIDAATLVVEQTIALGFTPAVAAIAPNGELWVTDTDNGKLVFLRASDGMKLGELATGAGAHAIAFSGDGAKAYVTNQLANSVAVVDIASKIVSETVTVGAKPNGIVFRGR